jgi:glycosyltransferase involved in cell wall biosynthesis
MPGPIRIAFAIDNMHTGGTELNAVRIAERLDRDRFDVRVVCLNQDGSLRERYAAAGIPVTSFPIASLHGPSAVRQGVRLARFLRAEGVTILHTHDIYSNVFAVPWGRLAATRVIASRRWWEGFRGGMWRTATRASYRLAHMVLANSASIGKRLETEGVSARRIAIVPNFLDETAFRPPDPADRAALRQELRLNGASPVVGIVANLLPVKDHATLLRAAAMLRADWPHLRLVLVGEGPCREALEQLTRELDLAKTVVFAGKRPSAPNLHHLFDVSVLCSTSEGLPNSLLEAMAAARPVVATRVGGVADAVADGETGLLVPQGDPEQLAAALNSLLADPPRAACLGRAGSARARTEHSADVALGALERLYTQLAGDNPNGRCHPGTWQRPSSAHEEIRV